MPNVSLSHAAPIDAEQNGSGGRLVTADGRTLPLRGATLRADARGGVARVVLEQRFENVYDEPLHVTYLMPLPADGAVSGYAFTMGARRVVGEVDKKRRARERFEEALLTGKTAGIVVEERSSLFTQELGNVPPRSTIVAELTIDQRLTWLDEGAWEWRFPTVAGPRYQGAPGRVEDSRKTEIAVADAPLAVRIALELAIRDPLPDGRRPESALHAIAASSLPGRWEVGFAAEGGVRLDRDVVVRWPVAAPKVGLSVDVGRPAKAANAYGLVSIVPPSPGSDAARARRRDLILLLDTSGSMGGEPLAQSVRTCLALIDTLGDEDSLEMIEFSMAARRWKTRAVTATAANKRDARRWLEKLEAGGGTEMVAGVMEALAPLSGEAQRQVVLLTDGYIGFETEVVKAVSDRLPAGSRLHVVGVGSAVNRSLTGPTARAGRGVEVIVGPGEDPERPVARLLARTTAPIVTDVVLSGDALKAFAPARLPDLYAGSPALAAVELRPEGGTLVVRGRTATGQWEQTVRVAACAPNEGAAAAAAALFARERVEDLELRRAAGAEPRDIDAAIEEVGLAFQISTRLTTWIAVSQEITVDPSAPTRREDVPQELPHGVSAEGLGLRAGSTGVDGLLAAPPPMSAPAPSPSLAMPSAAGYGGRPGAPAAQGPMKRASGILGGIGEAVRGMFRKSESSAAADSDDEGGLYGGRQEATGANLPAPMEPATDEAEEAAKESREQVLDRKVMREKSVDAPKPTPAAPPPAKTKVAATEARRRDAGRRRRAVLKLRRGRTLVIELVIAGGDAVDWDPAARATVALSDGTTLEAAIDAGKATRAGRYVAGQVIRIVVELAVDAPATPVEMTIGDLALEVVTA